jgi:hypothetical protein
LQCLGVIEWVISGWIQSTWAHTTPLKSVLTYNSHIALSRPPGLFTCFSPLKVFIHKHLPHVVYTVCPTSLVPLSSIFILLLTFQTRAVSKTP